MPVPVTAVPVTQTVTLSVAASADDVTETNDSSVALTSSYLQVGRPSSSTVKDVGLRFANSPVPPGATILDARITVTAYNGSSYTVATVFRGLETPNVAAFSSTNRPSRIAKTSASAAWSPGSWSSGNSYSSPNLSNIIQEIVRQPAWRQGNALGLAWEDNGTVSGRSRTVYSRDNSSSRSAKLSITYTYDPNPGPDTTPPTVRITSPATGASISGRADVTADVTDDRGVAEVGFYADGALIASDTAAPYATVWDATSVPEGTHSLSVRAVDTSGNLTVASVTPEVDHTPPVISGLRVSNTATSTLSVSWTTGEPASSRLEYGTTTAYGSSTATDTAGVTSHSVTVSGLTPETVYHFRAVSADPAGNTSVSTDVSARTLLGPVTASVTVTVAVAADDVTELNDTTIVATGTSLAVGSPSEHDSQDVGFRFAAVPIPPGAEVLGARLTLTAYSSSVSEDISTRFIGLLTPNVARFTSTNRPSRIAKTSGSVSWSPATWSVNGKYDSPDLTSIVREIVGQSGWRQGNAIGIAWQDSNSSDSHYRRIYARDYSAARAAKLAVTYRYVPPDVTPPTVRITSPSPGAILSGVVTVAADAADERGVAAVGFYADGVLVSTDTAAPYTCSVDTAGWAGGNHTLTARAVDASGNAAVDSVTCATTDLSAPAISAFRVVSVAPDSISVSWSTNEPATSRVEYGITEGYGSSTATDAALSTSHAVTIPGLTSDTSYHLRAVSADGAGNLAFSGDLATATVPPPSSQTITVDLLSSTDDVVEVNDSSIRALDGYLEVGRADGTNVTDVGLRFPSVPLPKGAVVREAHVTFLAYGYGLTGALNSVFRGIRTENLAAFSDTNRPSQAPLTSASAVWAPPGWTPGAAYSSPDLKDIVQEIIDQPGWSEGAPIGLAWDDAGTPAWQARLVYSHDDWTGPAFGPRLSITYSYDAGPDTTPPTVRLTSPAAGASVGGVVPIAATAVDDRGVAAVGFYVDGTLIATDTVAPYSTSWDTASWSTGGHMIVARAVDAAGNTASDALTCSVLRDTVAPVISNVSVVPGTRSATVVWTTDEPATSIVSFGKTSLLGSITADPSPKTAHSVVLSGLDPSSVYYYTVTSADGSGNSASSMMATFATAEAPRVPGPPVASFGFDDTYENAYTIAYPVLRSHGFRATEYLVTDIVGTGTKLTLAQIQELRDAGWEIGSHTADHAPGSTPEAYEATVKRASDWLTANGFTGGGFASPGGGWSHDIVRVVRKYHPYLRVADNVNTGHPYDPYKVSTRFLSASTTIAEVRGWLDQAQQNREWVFFSMHGVSDNGFDTRPQLLEEIAQELESRRIPVFTAGEIIAGDRPPDTTIDAWVDSMQQPVFPTVEPPAVLSPTGWTEYWEQYFGYPVVEGMSGTALPTIRFSRSVPNGTYEVYANLYSSGAIRYRYFYSFNDPANPDAMFVDTDLFEGDRQYRLGTVTVTDGTFSLYTRRIDSLGTIDWYGAWGWIKLVR